MQQELRELELFVQMPHVRTIDMAVGIHRNLQDMQVCPAAA